MEKIKTENESPLSKAVSNPSSTAQVESAAATSNELYPERIPESQGDLADQAEIEIEQEIQAQIFKVRQRLKEQTKP